MNIRDCMHGCQGKRNVCLCSPVPYFLGFNTSFCASFAERIAFSYPIPFDGAPAHWHAVRAGAGFHLANLLIVITDVLKY